LAQDFHTCKGGGKVARLTILAGIKAQIGYKRKAGFAGGKPVVVAPNHLSPQDKTSI
jgi:putative transposase